MAEISTPVLDKNIRETIYNVIIAAADKAPTRAVFCEVKGQDEDYTQIVRRVHEWDNFDDISDDALPFPSATYILTWDGYDSDPMAEEDVRDAFWALELDHYTLAQVDFAAAHLSDDEHDKLTKNILPQLVEYQVPSGFYEERKCTHLAKHYEPSTINLLPVEKIALNLKSTADKK